MTAPTIAVVGKSGQLASALVRAAGASNVACVAQGRPLLDVMTIDSVAQFLMSVRPSVIVNAAAYTAVDNAESEPDLAFRINAGAPALLATLANHFNIPLIHISTDYVFSGFGEAPYKEDDLIAPLGVYGASKAAGEVAVRGAAGQSLILRTSWVYGAEGANFVKTMLRLGRERDVVNVVGDQRGCPTSADDLAQAIISISRHIADAPEAIAWGTYHVAGNGETSWHGFAAEIFRQAGARGWSVPQLKEITTAEYPTPAMRPRNSVLDTSKIRDAFGIALPDWRASLARCLDEVARNQSAGASA